LNVLREDGQKVDRRLEPTTYGIKTIMQKLTHLARRTGADIIASVYIAEK